MSKAVVSSGYTGPFTVTASVVGVEPASFKLTNQTLFTVDYTSGSGQSTVVNTAFAAPLVVTAIGNVGLPVAGVVVTFAGPPSGAGVNFENGTTATDLDVSRPARASPPTPRPALSVSPPRCPALRGSS